MDTEVVQPGQAEDHVPVTGLGHAGQPQRLHSRVLDEPVHHLPVWRRSVAGYLESPAARPDHPAPPQQLAVVERYLCIKFLICETGIMPRPVTLLVIRLPVRSPVVHVLPLTGGQGAGAVLVVLQLHLVRVPQTDRPHSLTSSPKNVSTLHTLLPRAPLPLARSDP